VTKVVVAREGKLAFNAANLPAGAVDVE